MATLKDSQRQEKRLSVELGGFRNSGSGNGPVHKSDIRTPHELIEAKITSAKSYSLKDSDLQKNADYAIVSGRIPIFLVEFQGSGNKWAIMSYDDYLELRERSGIGNEIT